MRVHALLLNHMCQFVYNAGGALRWKGDVAAYCEVLRSFEVPVLKEKLEGLQVCVSVRVCVCVCVVIRVNCEAYTRARKDGVMPLGTGHLLARP